MQTKRDGIKPSTTQIKALFDAIHTYHTNMILNPFYESTITLDSFDSNTINVDEQLSEDSSNSDCSSCSSRSSRDS